MDSAGDGFFAIIDETADAIRCALEVRVSATPLGLELRSGVHLGHCLISEEAADRARQARLAVADRGVRSLKGLPATRRVSVAAADTQQTATTPGA